MTTRWPKGPIVRARYGVKLPDGRVQCTVCPHECKLGEGQRGICFVRGCHNGELALLTYGRSSGFAVDPIEKKPLNHFLPGTAALSFGTAGCNLMCRFCQNWHLSKAREMETMAEEASPDDIARAAERTGSRSVAFTYNEPVIYLEYAVDVAAACRARGIKTVAVTAGYIKGEARREFFAAMDAANVDLKAFTDRFYRQLCGGDLQTVLDTLVYLKHETKVWFEITTLLIPGENDSVEEVESLSRWILRELGPDVPLHFTAFYPAWKMSDRAPTPPSTVRRARRQALDVGLHYVYTGNIHDPEGASTYCVQCGKLLIGRDGYSLTEWNLKGGKCRFCGAACAGVFEDEPGSWGSRIARVRL